MALPQSQASFASLPPELRIKVYRYLFANGRRIRPRLKLKKYELPFLTFPARLLSSNRLFNNEAAPIFYSSNRFSFNSMFDGVMFLKRIGRVKRTYTNAVVLDRYWIRNPEARNLHLDYDTVHEKVVDWIAEYCPSITCLSVGQVKANECGRWSVKAVEKLGYLISRMTQLDNVVYSLRTNYLVLSAGSMDDAFKTRSNYKAFEVGEVLEAAKDNAKAVRAAAVQKAAATRKANLAAQLELENSGSRI